MRNREQEGLHSNNRKGATSIHGGRRGSFFWGGKTLRKGKGRRIRKNNKGGGGRVGVFFEWPVPLYGKEGE